MVNIMSNKVQNNVDMWMSEKIIRNGNTMICVSTTDKCSLPCLYCRVSLACLQEILMIRRETLRMWQMSHVLGLETQDQDSNGKTKTKTKTLKMQSKTTVSRNPHHCLSLSLHAHQMHDNILKRYGYHRIISFSSSHTKHGGYQVWDDSMYMYYLSCLQTGMLAAVQPVGVKFCRTVDLSSRQVFSLNGGNIFTGLQMPDQKEKVNRFLGL